MAPRVPKAELAGPIGTIITQVSQRMFGQLPEPVEVLWHNRKVSRTGLSLGAKVQRWDAVDENLKTFAHMAVASQVGCGWCLDLGYFQAQNAHLDLTKASQVPRWRTADFFTPLERDVMAYAEAMTTTPPTVTDELSARLLDHLGAAAMVELTAFIAFSNFSTRTNTALGIESQGFSATCEIPLATRPDDSAVGSSA
jgi:alkylhydroperoxidase family enzyme